MSKESIQEKGTQPTYFSLQSVTITVILLNVTDPLITPIIFIVLFCSEKAHNYKEFSRKNSKPRCESRITSRPIKSNPVLCYLQSDKV